MKKLLLSIATLLFSPLALTAQTSITASSVVDSFNRPIASANLCFQPVDATETPVGFRVGTSQILPSAVCGLVSNGVLQSGLTVTPSPTGIYYHIWVANRLTSAVLRDFGMTSITGSSWSMDSYDPSTSFTPVGTLSSGTITTGAPGTSAACTIGGSSPTYLLNCAIPQGATGATGPQGASGAPYTGVTSDGSNGLVATGALHGNTVGNIKDCSSGTPSACLSSAAQPVMISAANGTFTANPFDQYAAGTATASCYADQTTGHLTIYPTFYGYGYGTTAPTVTITGVPSGASVSGVTATLTSGTVTGYTVGSSSGFTGTTATIKCPVTISITSPPTPAAPQQVMDTRQGLTAFQAVIRPEDFGCIGNGTADDTDCLNYALQYAASTSGKAITLTQGKTYFLGHFTGQVRSGGDNGVVAGSGLTCNGATCSTLAPNYTYIGYSLNVPQGVTIIGNGATIAGGFTSTAVTATSYGTSWPYGALMLTNNNVNVYSLNITNGLIGVIPSSFDLFDSISPAGNGCVFVSQNSQFNSYRHISSHGSANLCGWFLGGSSVDRAPLKGSNASTIANAANIADDINLVDIQLWGPFNNSSSTGSGFTASRKALDCWFDQQIVHAEDSGYINSDACYSPNGYTTASGGNARLTDQDIAALATPDWQWRGVYGTGLSMLPMYSRPWVGGVIRDFVFKESSGYALNFNTANSLDLKNVYEEQDGYCAAGLVPYGNASCPNPYEPQNTSRLASVLYSPATTSSANNLVNIVPAGSYTCAISNPWNVGGGWSNQNFTPMVNTDSSACVAQTSTSPLPLGGSNEAHVYIGSSGAAQGINSDSRGAYWGGSKFVPGGPGNRSTYWRLGTRNAEIYTAKTTGQDPTIFEVLASLNGSMLAPGYAYLKAPGLAIDPNPAQGGQLTSVTINTAGAGYTPYSHIACSVTPAPQEVPNTTITGTNLVSSGDTWTPGTNWSGSFSGGFVHTAGSTATVVDSTFTPAANSYYVVTFTLSSTTAGPVVLTMGGSTSVNYGVNGTYTFRVLASNTNPLTITPATTFIGTIGTISVVNVSTSSLYTATCDAVANASGGVSKVNVVYPALGYTSAPNVSLTAPTGTGATAATLTPNINSLTTYNALNHLVVDSTYLASGGTVPAFGSTTITNVSCPDAFYSASSTADAITILQPGQNVGVVPTLVATAWTTSTTGQCTIHLSNPTNATITYAQGPWVLLLQGEKGTPPNTVSSASTATTDTTSVASGSAAQGGTGINSSSSTGSPVVNAGVWSITAVPAKPIGTAIASSGTIAPTTSVVHITGTVAIATITPPSGCSTTGMGCEITLIPDAAWSTNTLGNIAIVTNAVVSKALRMIYDATAAKWYPSY